jgi:hypothetical protein
MASCRGCGVEARRTITSFEGGEVKGEACPECRPDLFPDDPFLMPSDRKLYMGWEAYPEHYKMKDNPEGGKIAVASDSMIADSVALMNKTDEQIAVDQKRRTRRTEPLTSDEIKRAEHWGKEVLRPKLERARLNRQYHV